MKIWFKNWRHGRELDLESELKASRPTPSSQLVKAIAARVNPRPANPVRTRSRIAIAGVATAAMVAALGASGGFSSAASSIAGAAKSVAASAHATSPGPSHLPGAPGPERTNRVGGGGSSSAAQYNLAPTITDVSPAQGAPGATITVTGTNFTGLNAVTEVDLGAEATLFNVTSATTLNFTVPSDAASGATTITVKNGTLPNATHAFTVLGVPHIDSVDTDGNVGVAEGGAGSPVVINGHGFTGVTSVLFGKTKATISGTPTDVEIDTSVPASLTKAGVVQLTVVNPAGTSNTVNYTIDANAPSITKVSPPNGTAATTPGGTDGTLVTITGKNLQNTTDVFFNGTDQSTVSNASSTSVQARVPFGATTGPVTVATDVGQATAKGSFVVIGSATVSSVSPTFGKVGTSVTITGTSFTGATNVKFGGTDAGKITVKGDTTITAKVPSGAPSGFQHIVVTNGNGDGPSSAATFDVLTTAPDATSALPATGGAGTSVAIGGSNFTGASKVTFNGKAASFRVVDDTHITAFVPVGAPTSGPGIVVSNAVGNDATPVAFAVLADAPTIATFKPANGVAGADTITITGTNLQNATVSFGGSSFAASASHTTDGKSLTVVVPNDGATGQVVVKNADGQAASKGTFTVINTPIIVGFNPAYAAVKTKVNIVGANLAGASEVDFPGGVSAKPTVNKDGSITAAVPAGATGSGVITVKVKSLAGTVRQSDSGSSVITIVTKPTGLSVAGPTVHGTTVHITATSGLTGTTAVKAGKTSLPFQVNSDTDLSVTLPSTPGTYKIAVGNAAGTAMITITVT